MADWYEFTYTIEDPEVAAVLVSTLEPCLHDYYRHDFTGATIEIEDMDYHVDDDGIIHTLFVSGRSRYDSAELYLQWLRDEYPKADLWGGMAIWEPI